jgi:hypothetical protein
MNHITRLTNTVNTLVLDAETRAERIAEFRAHLASPKFGPQQDGTRGDWIATADVQRWLNYIEQPV